MSDKKNKCALLIGIDYVGDKYELDGCINDVHNMQKLIKTFGFEDIKILKDRGNKNRATYPYSRTIITEIDKMCDDRKNFHMFLHYAGHGVISTDVNGDEKYKKDECIVPLDYSKGFITDDVLSLLIRDLHKSSRLDIVFDCCHSGAILDLPYNFKYINGKIKQKSVSNSSGNIFFKNRECGEIVVFSGCLDGQIAKEITWKNKEGACTGAMRRYLAMNKDASLYDILYHVNKMLIKKGIRNQNITLSTNIRMTIEDLKKRKFFNDGYPVYQKPKNKLPVEPAEPKLKNNRQEYLKRHLHDKNPTLWKYYFE